MPDIFLDVDVALSAVPVNTLPLISSVDQQSVVSSLAYNASGLQIHWNFVTTDGQFTRTQVIPTSGGAYDWTAQGGGIHTIEIPASAGASINNNQEGTGWFTGVADGVIPWRGPTIGFRAAVLNDALMDGGGVGALSLFGIVDQGVAQAVGANSIQLRVGANRVYRGQVVSIRQASSGAGQYAVITNFSTGTVTATISPAWEVTPTGPVEYVVFGAPAAPTDSGSLPGVRVDEMSANTITAAAIAADAVAELQAGISGIDAAGIRAAIGMAAADLDDQITGILQAIAAIFTTQMAESYAANGVMPTPAQALMAIHQHLMDFSIAGTSRTVQRLDGAPAFVETLNSATNPTGLNR